MPLLSVPPALLFFFGEAQWKFRFFLCPRQAIPNFLKLSLDLFVFIDML